LGNTGIKVSRICFGSLTLGPLCANLTLNRGIALISAAIDLGVSFIDTAEQYRTYSYIKGALDATDKTMIVATKTYAQTGTDAAYAVEDARLALGRNTLDIFLLHEVQDETDFCRRAPAWQVLLDAKNNGAINAVGISTHSAKVAAMAAHHPQIEIIHPMLNIAGIGINDGSVEDMLTAIADAKREGKGVYGMKALGGGALMREAKKALLWAYEQPDLDAIAIGFKDEAELVTNIGWYDGQEPPEAKKVNLLDRNLAYDKDPICHGCGQCIKRCPQGALSFSEDHAPIWDKSKCIYCGYCIAACPWFCLSFC